MQQTCLAVDLSGSRSPKSNLGLLSFSLNATVVTLSDQTRFTVVAPGLNVLMRALIARRPILARLAVNCSIAIIAIR